MSDNWTQIQVSLLVVEEENYEAVQKEAYELVYAALEELLHNGKVKTLA